MSLRDEVTRLAEEAEADFADADQRDWARKLRAALAADAEQGAAAMAEQRSCDCGALHLGTCAVFRAGAAAEESQGERAAAWVRRCFGDPAMARSERAARLMEEAIELAQAEGVGLALAERVVARAYSRPAGDPAQEAGGVGMCLAAWAVASGVDVNAETERELARVEALTVEHFKARHAAKVAAGSAAARPGEPAASPGRRGGWHTRECIEEAADAAVEDRRIPHCPGCAPSPVTPPTAPAPSPADEEPRPLRFKGTKEEFRAGVNAARARLDAADAAAAPRAYAEDGERCECGHEVARHDEPTGACLAAVTSDHGRTWRPCGCKSTRRVGSREGRGTP